MASRGRASVDGSSEETQLWQSVRTKLKSLDTARSASLAGYERLLRAQTEAPKKLEGIYNVVENSILDEHRAIDGALEHIDVLIALRQASMSSQPDGRRRKRHVDETGDDGLSDTSTGPDTKHRSNSEQRRTRVTSGAHGKRGVESDTRSSKRALQLPLQRGQKVAFCQPQPDGEGGEVWIMATVIGMINNDPKRYTVQDAEDEGTSGPTYQTTIKSIAPLPISLDTLPPEEFRVGTRVLALYPDTSCFYNATVRGGGPLIPASTPRTKLQKREKELLHTPYQLMFEDDGADIKQVPAYLVVEHP